MDCLKQDKIKISQMNILKKGKKQDISNWYLANQEGKTNKNIKILEIENIVMILLCSICVLTQAHLGDVHTLTFA